MNISSRKATKQRPRKSALRTRKVACTLYAADLPSHEPNVIELPKTCRPEELQHLVEFRLCILHEEFHVLNAREWQLYLDRVRPASLKIGDRIDFGSCGYTRARYLNFPDKKRGRGEAPLQVSSLAVDPLHGIFLYVSVSRAHKVFRIAYQHAIDGALDWGQIGHGRTSDITGFDSPEGMVRVRS